jgi:squalene-hopene/tetraprenyl-beta-curcumene cyclase
MLACSRPALPRVTNSWDRAAAAAYLDGRQVSWTQWIGAARDHGTYCVSCHTTLPYALARPALRSALAQEGLSPNEKNLIANVAERVRLWKTTEPYYGDQGYDRKAGESRGTEAVLNALILSNNDAQKEKLSEDTQAAFDNMWSLQLTVGDKKGSWPWLQFDQEPWEAKDSDYYGACLAAIAVGTAPEHYASTPEIQEHLKLLREYLKRESASQSTINKVFLLWASTRLPGLLSAEEQNSIVKEALDRQQSDGGWRLAAISWNWSDWSTRSLFRMWFREDGTPLSGKSDGVATGLVTFVLEEAGIPHDNAQLQRGLRWLMSNQTAQGFWPALSINKRRDPSSNTGRFMSDAGTAFAVLALTRNREPTKPTASLSNRQ